MGGFRFWGFFKFLGARGCGPKVKNIFDEFQCRTNDTPTLMEAPRFHPSRQGGEGGRSGLGPVQVRVRVGVWVWVWVRVWVWSPSFGANIRGPIFGAQPSGPKLGMACFHCILFVSFFLNVFLSLFLLFCFPSFFFCARPKWGAAKNRWRPK